MNMQLKLFLFLLSLFSFSRSYALEQATFAGGCFWCMETPFENLDGVQSVISGYTGGSKLNPTYEEVSSGKTGHAEAVQITFDPSKISYEELLEVFWKNIDPTDAGGQFVDRGNQYRSEIFYHSKEQEKIAKDSKDKLKKSGVFKKPIVTQITEYGRFYPAEEYHQDYYKKSELKYKYYRYRSGRDQFIESAWKDKKDYMIFPSCPRRAAASEGKKMPKWSNFKKPSKQELKEKLSDLEYKVTQEEGTERAFQNKYWDNKEDGIYVDVVSGEPLFSSKDKYDSGTGWPSFSKPIEKGNITTKEDKSLFSTRTEVRSKNGDSHLGHVFDDGPGPDGKRYCMNSASLRFVPVKDLEKEGYGEFLSLFKSSSK